MISFAAKYWVIFLPSILIAAAGVAILLYFRNTDTKELGKTKTLILSILRFFSFFLVSLLLLTPLLKRFEKITKDPIIIAAWDNSGSMVSLSDSLIIRKKLIQLNDEIKNRLGSEYKIIDYTFGENTKNTTRQSFNEKKSDYGDLITTVTNNHFNENIGALIITGDGIINQGKNPLNLTENLGFPVYTIGFGDTTLVSDGRIEGIRVNRTSFTGNRFPVEIDTRYLKLGGRPLKLSIRENDSEKVSTIIIPSGNDYFNTQVFMLESQKSGLVQYSISLQSTDNERNIKNNTYSFVVHVLDKKQKIVIISNGSHPDVGAIKNTLDQQLSYEVDVFTEEPYPSELKDVNLLILNQLPSSFNSISSIMETTEKNQIPVLFIVGNNSYIPQFNLVAKAARLNLLATTGEEAQPLVNPSFISFNISEDLLDLISKLPPLQTHFANYEVEPEITPFLFQRIKNIDTSKPLISLGYHEGRKTGFIFGEGIWKWRIYNYYNNQTHAEFNELINQIVQYLSFKKNKENFIIDCKPVYSEIDNIIINSEVYNDNFERIMNQEITVSIKNQENNELKFMFEPKGDGYQLNAGYLPVGNYTCDANVKIGEKNFSKTFSFSVAAVNQENINTRANHQLLFQLAKQTGGEFFEPDQTDELFQLLKNNKTIKSTSYYQELVNEILNLKWVFFFILFLLSMEWFLRKYWGIY